MPDIVDNPTEHPDIHLAFQEQDALWDSVSEADRNAPALFELGVAETLRALREEAGWSQQFAVDRLMKVWGIEMHQTTLAKLEAGRRPLRLSELFALATLYGVSVLTVLTRQETAPLRAEAALNERLADYNERFETTKGHLMTALSLTIDELAAMRSQAHAMADLISSRAAHRPKPQDDADG